VPDRGIKILSKKPQKFSFSPKNNKNPACLSSRHLKKKDPSSKSLYTPGRNLPRLRIDKQVIFATITA